MVNPVQAIKGISDPAKARTMMFANGEMVHAPLNAVSGSVIHGATAKATPVDADEFGYYDSVSAGPVKATWANIKAALKTYFDTIYQPLSAVLTALSGLGTAVAGDVIYSSAAGTWARLAKGTALQHLRMNSTATAPEWAAAREVLTANRTYFVRSDGSDSNTGLVNSSGGAFLTIQKALNTAATLDFSGFVVTIQIGDGTYTVGGTVPVTVGQSSTNSLVIQGNATTPGNVVISTTSADCFNTATGGRALVQNMQLQTTTGGYCLKGNGGGSELQWSNIVFGACAASHVLAQALSNCTCVGNYSITGAAAQHWQASNGGGVEVNTKTITITGTPAFSSAFALATQGFIRPFSNTYSGAATGVRYNANMNGTIQTFGAGATALPGNAAGTTATGGQYA